MREVVSIHVGQAGIQIGNSCWELYCQEHNIGVDGTPKEKADSINSYSGIDDDLSNNCLTNAQFRDACGTFFAESETGSRYTPRAILADLEPSVIDEISNGTYRDLFNPLCMYTAKQDAANNFARGCYTVGSEALTPIMDKVRTLVENCNSLQAFLIFNSSAGGTGSGLGALIAESISKNYAKTTNIAFCCWPSATISTTVVEPYNSILTTQAFLNDTHITALLDNQAIYDICKNHLGVENPFYSNLNRIIGQLVSSWTSSLRFQGPLNIDITELQTNLVPFPRIHFMLSSYSPLVSTSNSLHTSASVTDLTRDAFSETNMLVKCDPSKGKYMACCLQFRGDVTPREANAAIAATKTKKNIEFVDWCPTGFKCGINTKKPTYIEGGDLGITSRAVSMMANSTAIVDLFKVMNQKFDSLYSRRAFVHWYVGEGMEEGEFTEARENIAALERDYEEVDRVTAEDDSYEY